MRTWDEIAEQLAALPPHFELVIPKSLIEHPEEAGAKESQGLPFGQSEDWRFPADKQCRGLHVHVYDDEFRAHLDRHHPDCGVLKHIAKDVPAVLPLGVLALMLLGVWAASRR